MPTGAVAPANAPVSTGGEVALAMPVPAPAVPGEFNFKLDSTREQPKAAAPVFGDAPIAGAYFRHTTNSKAEAPNTTGQAPVLATELEPTFQSALSNLEPAIASNFFKLALAGGTSRDQNVEVFQLPNGGEKQATQILQKMFSSQNVATSETPQVLAPGGNSQPQVAETFNPGVSGNSPVKPVITWSANGSLRGYYDDNYAAAKKPASDQAKRQLEQKLEQRRVLYAKLQNEKVNLALPQTAMVQITDPARTNQDRTFWQHLTGQYESQARLKVENDATDIPGMSDGRQYGAYDPNFIQTTFETIKSERVLSNVVSRLNLQSAWADKNGGQKLTLEAALSRLKSQLDLQPVRNTKIISIGVTSDDPAEAAKLANAVSEAYRDYRLASRQALTRNGTAALEQSFADLNRDIQTNAEYLQRLERESHPQVSPSESTPAPDQSDRPLRKPAPNTPVPQPEILTSTNAFSTFSLNVSDVSFKFAAASLQNNQLPDTASIRSEEFINAFDYRDPEAAAGQPMAFAAERARYPFAHNRELLRFAIKTAAAGRQEGRALNLVLLLDVSGSMERADRVAIIHEALRVLGTQLQPQDTVSVVTFARTARLWADGIPGNKAAATLDRVGGITPEGGTNLEEAMRLAYETALRHYLAAGMNRVVLLTDGAANLGDVSTADLQAKVETQRKQGIALDCFGIGWEDYNDDLLETLSSHGDGRYAFLNSPEDAAKDFAAKLAGALQIAAADVKVQVEFNPTRVIAYRQIGYAKHQLTKEQFRDNTVAAGEIAAQEAGNALYTIETNPAGDGPVATVHVRYRIPGTSDYREQSWDVPYTGTAPALEQASAAMRLAAVAGAFSEWLAANPYAQEVTPNALLNLLRGVPEIYGADNRPKQLETMILEARSLEGKGNF
jgi:Mg-chelatase subunit ChlD